MKLAAVLAVLAVCLIAVGPVGTAFASNKGFAAYSITVQSKGATSSITVNESVSAGPKAGLDILGLAVASAGANLSYSREVNSTLDLFPYLPAISDQNLSFSYGGYQLAADVSQNGSSAVVFQGGSYQLSDYAFSASVVSRGGSGTGRGSAAVFPSGLVYSLTLEVNGSASLSATLLATSLPLTAGASNSLVQTASVGLGAGAVVSVVALSLGVRSRHRQKQSPAKKPDYWVD
ncbi:MAG TPA: hypothetical protein VLY21_01605 [Nitrososphaerales archaeon]|nr:hypothetical protein [Nitrososphaerales archaeon]